MGRGPAAKATTQSPRRGIQRRPAGHTPVALGLRKNAAAIYWQTERQTAEALRFMAIAVTDTTCKTNSTAMEYGCVMGYNARRETVHQGHYMLNGLTRANYGSMWKMYRLFMGARAVGRLSYIGTDGDQWLGEATGAEIDGGGSLHVGGRKIHGLCRFHTVNIPLMVVMSKHGFTVENLPSSRHWSLT